MKTWIKMTGFALVLVVVLAGSYGLGRAVAPVGDTAPDTVHAGADMTVGADHGGQGNR